MSFETSWGVPPPAMPTPDKSTSKRKRPSAGGDPSAAKVEGASINLEKLMGLMEKEAQQPKAPSGKDLKKAAAKKDRAPAAGAAPAAAHPAQAERGPAAKKQKHDRPAPAPKAPQEPKEPRVDGKAEKGKGRGKNKAARKANAEAAAAGGAAVALPPHMDMDVDAAASSSSSAPVIALKPLAGEAPAKVAPAAAAPQSPAAGEQKKSKKAQKKERLAAAAAAASGSISSASAAAAAASPAPKKAAFDSKKNVVELDDEPAPAAAPTGPADSALTPMQLKMKRKLEGSRFRWINEQLYTTSSDAALDMMRKDPSVFSDYHLGFRSQTELWPTSPVTILTDKLSAALPTSALIIDLGCGDAALAKTLIPAGYKVLSYDLVGDEWVTECDYCTGIPLPGKEAVAAGSAQDSRIVDGAVCCLSLMGRNWMQGVREIARTLKEGGRFEIAEVQSRMSSTEAFVDMISSLGFTLESKDESNTHFILLSFVREGEPTWDADGEKSWEDVLQQGEEVLKACVYKKR